MSQSMIVSDPAIEEVYLFTRAASNSDISLYEIST